VSVEQTVQKIFKDVLDVEADEINPDQPLSKAFGVDSTEMVEITVGIKKALGLDIQNNTFGKDQSYNQIVEFCKSQKVS
jgi:acyl carrier protein